MPTQTKTLKETTCFHCGDSCGKDYVKGDEKVFCCQGCKMVYEIINQNNLCEYYDISSAPGIKQRTKVREGKFAFLEDASIAQKLIHFSSGTEYHVTFYLPQIHCSSCIWLLENLNKLNVGIIKTQVNFLKRELTVVYENNKVGLKELAELLTQIGYEPHISLKDGSEKKASKYDRSGIYKIGIAGFCFANIMMFSFPEYFSSGDINEAELKNLFNILNLLLSIPVFFYCASEFFVSAYSGLRQKFLNIDAPIALALLITFTRSIYEIISATGTGYLDSMSGIVFFMLLGRFFQKKTYQILSFDRDYTSYFPLGVCTIGSDGEEKYKPVSQLKTGDRIKIYGNEIIPADGILFLGKANIDYSFVTGESVTTEKCIGEIIYAGGKQVGGAIELEVVKETSNSYLTQLWNNRVFKKERKLKASFIHGVSRYFTYVLLSIAVISFLYWSSINTSAALNALTSVLIVACPCALLLSATFTNANMLHKLSLTNFFVKDADALESLSEADTIVFDKTGTITRQEGIELKYEGEELSEEHLQMIRAVAAQSNHPLCRAMVSVLPIKERLPVSNFSESVGRGISASVNGTKISIGSVLFVGEKELKTQTTGSVMYIKINDKVFGRYLLHANYREGLNQTIKQLNKTYKLYVLSGDNNTEELKLKEIFGKSAEMLFNQSPLDKLNFIKKLQQHGQKVIMIGDGLNDAGALQQSDAGIAITEGINNFSPGCDAILEGKQFTKLKFLLDYCKTGKGIIYGSFCISILYNLVGLFFAVQGNLSPLIAAILMPVSSISIVLYTTGLSSWYAGRIRENKLLFE